MLFFGKKETDLFRCKETVETLWSDFLVFGETSIDVPSFKPHLRFFKVELPSFQIFCNWNARQFHLSDCNILQLLSLEGMFTRKFIPWQTVTGSYLKSEWIIKSLLNSFVTLVKSGISPIFSIKSHLPHPLLMGDVTIGDGKDLAVVTGGGAPVVAPPVGPFVVVPVTLMPSSSTFPGS